MTLLSLTALPLAVCASFAEARGVGAGFQAPVQVAASVGRATNSQVTSPDMASQARVVIVAERAPIQVRASEAASLLEDLRVQLAAQPEATLQFHWRLTQPDKPK